VELGVILRQGGRDIKQSDWKKHIGGYFLLIDYTDRVRLDFAIKNSLPWLTAKVSGSSRLVAGARQVLGAE